MEEKISKILNMNNLTIDDIRGKSRRLDVTIIRSYIVYFLIDKGYKREDVAKFVNRNRTTTYNAEFVIKTNFNFIKNLINGI